MTIPDYQTVMLPLMRFANANNEHSLREAIEVLADEFKLSFDERKELLPSGQQAVFDNRVGWARTYLKKAGLLEPTRRGYCQITARGRKALHVKLERIDVEFLKQYPEFIEFRQAGRERATSTTESCTSQEQTPEEKLETIYEKFREDLASELLQAIMQCSPGFFERMVIDLLVSMRYGGSRKEAGQAVGQTSDGGIDGIIKEDRLGLDIIYVQAKRWEGSVGRPEIQKFAGALQGQRARKGIFIATSKFTREACEYTKTIESKIILVDGDQLAGFMIYNNVGVSPVISYEIKKMDVDYFSEE